MPTVHFIACMTETIVCILSVAESVNAVCTCPLVFLDTHPFTHIRLQSPTGRARIVSFNGVAMVCISRSFDRSIASTNTKEELFRLSPSPSLGQKATQQHMTVAAFALLKLTKPPLSSSAFALSFGTQGPTFVLSRSPPPQISPWFHPLRGMRECACLFFNSFTQHSFTVVVFPTAAVTARYQQASSDPVRQLNSIPPRRHSAFKHIRKRRRRRGELVDSLLLLLPFDRNVVVICIGLVSLINNTIIS